MIDMMEFSRVTKTFELELLTHVAPMKEGETISILAQSILIPDIFRIVRHYGTYKDKPVEVCFQTIDGKKIVKIKRISLMDINGSIANLQIGESHTFKSPNDIQKRSIRNYAHKWTKMDAECTFSCEQKGDDMVVTRIEGKDIGPGRKVAYPEIDDLRIGESLTFKMPRWEHQRIRLACSERNKSLDRRYSANVVPDGICVTRIPATSEERLTYPHQSFQRPQRKSKWGLERLAEQTSYEISNLEPEDHHRLRLSCAQKANTTGWKIKCSIDRATGTATVTRCG